MSHPDRLLTGKKNKKLTRPLHRLLVGRAARPNRADSPPRADYVIRITGLLPSTHERLCWVALLIIQQESSLQLSPPAPLQAPQSWSSPKPWRNCSRAGLACITCLPYFVSWPSSTNWPPCSSNRGTRSAALQLFRHHLHTGSLDMFSR